jgi:ABC-type bacteriocin/lantibiotic exporter with double-glycine peptidase domain
MELKKYFLDRSLRHLLSEVRPEGVIFLMLAVALLEAFGLLTVLPVLQVLIDPSGTTENLGALAIVSMVVGDQLPKDVDILAPLVFFSCSVLLLSAIFRSYGSHKINIYASKVRHTCACYLLRSYLSKELSFHFTNHSSLLIKNVLNEVDHFVGHMVMPALNIVVQTFIFTSVFIILFLTDWAFTLLIALAFSISYLLIFILVRPVLRQLSEKRFDANKVRFKAANNAITGIKDIKLRMAEAQCLDEFAQGSRAFNSSQAWIITIGHIPRFWVEGIAISCALLGAFWISQSPDISSSNNLVSHLPKIGFFVLSALKLLPSVQGIYQSISQLRVGWVAFNSIKDELGQLYSHHSDRQESNPTQRLPRNASIKINNVYFRYPNSERFALKGVSFQINQGETIGIIGRSGSGKSTLADLLLGLLVPTKGQVLVGLSPLQNEVIPAWRESVGYLQQETFLTDKSIAENIAFGRSKEITNMEEVVACAKAANIHEFIMDLPFGYDTAVGERGVLISGGERQRLGIARALFGGAGVLIMDEATSSLDGVTEDAIVSTLQSFRGQKTMVLIAHRINTLRECDRILVLNDGEVEACGTFEEVSLISKIPS